MADLTKVAKTMTGSRAVLYIDNLAVGIFETVSYNKNFGTEPIHTLGAYGAREIVINSMEAVTLSCGAFRVIGSGATKLGRVPKVSDLMNYESCKIRVQDRQSGKDILIVDKCVPNSESGAHNARAASRVTISYTGTIAWDEESQGDGESGGSPNYPS